MPDLEILAHDSDNAAKSERDGAATTQLYG